MPTFSLQDSTHIEPAASPDLGDTPKPVPGRKAAKAAAERLSELCRESSVDIGVQAVTEEAHDKMFNKYGFTSEQMTSFRLTLERDHSIGCPVEVCVCVCVCVLVEASMLHLMVLLVLFFPSLPSFRIALERNSSYRLRDCATT